MSDYHKIMNRVPVLFCCLMLFSCQQKLKDVRTFSYTGGNIQSGSLSYDTLPPAGGSYNIFWQTCQFYSSPIYAEYAVHSLARGALWLTYRSEIKKEDLMILQKKLTEPFLRGRGSKRHEVVPELLISPIEQQEASLMLTAWNAQISADDIHDPQLLLFQRTFAAADAPHQGSCQNGFTGTR